MPEQSPRVAAATLVPIDELAELGDRLRASGQRIVFTNGCFDLMHAGHVRYLAAARDLGDRLVVGVNSDSSVRTLKGPNRPVIGQEHRLEVLAGLRSIDYLTVFDEGTPERAIRLLRPDIHVKGGDYRAEDLPEAGAVTAGGGRVVILPLVGGLSTTEIVRRLREGSKS